MKEMINILEIFTKESVFDQIKRIRKARIYGGIFPLSAKVMWFMKENNISYEYLYKPSKIKRYNI